MFLAQNRQPPSSTTLIPQYTPLIWSRGARSWARSHCRFTWPRRGTRFWEEMQEDWKKIDFSRSGSAGSADGILLYSEELILYDSEPSRPTSYLSSYTSLYAAKLVALLWTQRGRALPLFQNLILWTFMLHYHILHMSWFRFPEFRPQQSIGLKVLLFYIRSWGMGTFSDIWLLYLHAGVRRRLPCCDFWVWC